MEKEAREELLLRLRSIEGHIRGIQRMLEDGRGCVDVVRQTLAVKRALDRVSRLLVADHVRCCLSTEPLAEAVTVRERTVQELLDVLELTGRL